MPYVGFRVCLFLGAILGHPGVREEVQKARPKRAEVHTKPRLDRGLLGPVYDVFRFEDARKYVLKLVEIFTCGLSMGGFCSLD